MLSSFLASAVVLALSAVVVVQAAPEPSEPSGATSAAVGSSLTTTWAADTTGSWTDTTIRLMSGNNFNFQLVTPIATGIDATTLTSYTFEVPDVTPNAQIYFLLFNPTNATDYSLATYTTRFLITAADGSSTEPANATQPLSDGVTPDTTTTPAVPWGVGTLASAYSVTTPSNNTAGSSDSASSSAVVESSSSTIEAAASSTAEVASSTAAATRSSAAASASASAAAASTTTAASGAEKVLLGGGGRGAGAFVVGVVGAVALMI
ncbi:hypothetical protein BDY24DRAFT_433593 [Mrakia frigida]|uniref:uncharacterized protein n=1 Tax=Mrakia frigida TaxID=29902 RepID=UPI003FCC0C11